MREPTRRRTASELYTLGVPLKIDDGATDWVPELDEHDQPVMEPVLDEHDQPMLDEHDQPVMQERLVEIALPPITLWVAKLGDLEMTTAMKKAARSQAVVMAARKDHDSEDWQSTYALMSALDRETWLSTLVDREMLDRWDLIGARVAGETITDSDGVEQPNEWAKDGYLDGLRDAWLDGLNATYAADPGDPEASRVYAEIERFTKLVDEEFAYERDVEVNVHETLSDEELLEKITDLMTETEGQSVWGDEYRLWCIALSARDCEGPDPRRIGRCLCKGSRRKHTELHFKDGYDEVAVTDGRVRTIIYAAFHAVMVDIREGKESRVSRASLPQFDLPAAEATLTSSGLVDASA